jgi:hypothetical protein
MNVEIGTKAAQFLLREYLFRIFSIVTLQCGKIMPVTINSFKNLFLNIVLKASKEDHTVFKYVITAFIVYCQLLCRHLKAFYEMLARKYNGFFQHFIKLYKQEPG